MTPSSRLIPSAPFRRAADHDGAAAQRTLAGHRLSHWPSDPGVSSQETPRQVLPPMRHSSILPVTLSVHSTGERWQRDSEPLVRSTGVALLGPSRL
jgi:hypothetical protein